MTRETTAPDDGAPERRPTLEEAFGGDDSVQLRYPAWLKGVFVAISAALVGGPLVLVDFPELPAWFHAIHVFAALAYGFATARILMREDRISSVDIETRSLTGGRRVTWDRVSEALLYDREVKGETWHLWVLPFLPALLSPTFDLVYDRDAMPDLTYLSFRSWLILAVTFGMGTGIVLLALAMLVYRARNRVGFGRCLVLRDAEGNTVFELPSWPHKGAEETVLRILAHLEVPVTRVGAGHRL